MKVSIILPNFNSSEFIKQTLKSIISQTYKNWELIIVDDNSDKSTKNILSKYKNKNKIKIFFLSKNKGAAYCRNLAIKKSRSDYIAFIDSDDLWKKNKLKKQIKFMKDNNLKFSFTSYEIIDNNDNRIGLREAQKSLSFKQLRNSCDIGLSTVMIKKSIFNNEKFKFGTTKTKEDFILWLILAKNGIEISGIKECLTSWRKNSTSLSSSNIQKIIDGYKVYRNYLYYSRLKSFFFLIILSLNFMLKKIR